ncbi:hypothetical protein PoB_007312700 [Plakobranchus ocellatus]|uniref:Uncharacterized protein n=1 Tax=Plakobranchus ocellatus TaxID=259542 RepID=A0AAV4DQM9_9GAST|nr:hypothetical protein PoB_007312700 [Plakobranchus ocellatus]
MSVSSVNPYLFRALVSDDLSSLAAFAKSLICSVVNPADAKCSLQPHSVLHYLVEKSQSLIPISPFLSDLSENVSSWAILEATLTVVAHIKDRCVAVTMFYSITNQSDTLCNIADLVARTAMVRRITQGHMMVSSLPLHNRVTILPSGCITQKLTPTFLLDESCCKLDMPLHRRI